MGNTCDAGLRPSATVPDGADSTAGSTPTSKRARGARINISVRAQASKPLLLPPLESTRSTDSTRTEMEILKEKAERISISVELPPRDDPAAQHGIDCDPRSPLLSSARSTMQSSIASPRSSTSVSTTSSSSSSSSSSTPSSGFNRISPISSTPRTLSPGAVTPGSTSPLPPLQLPSPRAPAAVPLGSGRERILLSINRRGSGSGAEAATPTGADVTVAAGAVASTHSQPAWPHVHGHAQAADEADSAEVRGARAIEMHHSADSSSSSSASAAALSCVRTSILGLLPVAPSALAALASCSHPLTFTRGAALFQAGDAADCLFIVASGSVAIELPPRAASTSALLSTMRRRNSLNGSLSAEAAGVSAASSSPLLPTADSPSSLLPAGRRVQLPPVAASGLRVQQVRARRQSAPLPLMALNTIRECPVTPIRIARSNISSQAPAATEVHTSAEDGSASRATAATQGSSAGPAGAAPLCVLSRGALVGAEQLLTSASASAAGSSAGSSSGPASSSICRRTYTTRCHSDNVQVLVLSYSELRTRVLPLISAPSESDAQRALQRDALCRLLTLEWMAEALSSVPSLRSLHPAALKLLAAVASPAALPANASLFGLGEGLDLESPRACLSAVLDGELEITGPTSDAHTQGQGDGDSSSRQGLTSARAEIDSSGGSGPSLTPLCVSSPLSTRLLRSGDVACPDSLPLSPLSSTAASGSSNATPIVCSASARTTRPSLIFRLPLRCVRAVTAHALGGGFDEPKPVPTLATVMSAQQQQAQQQAQAEGHSGSPTSSPLPQSPSGSASASSVPILPPLPSSASGSPRGPLSRYTDSELLLHPLFQKVLYVFCQGERPNPQHTLLEHWRDAVNFRLGHNRAQLSAREEAAILHRAYCVPSAPKFQSHLEPAILQAIAAGVAEGTEAGAHAHLFLRAELATEAALLSGPLARFKRSSAFAKIAPFVKMDAKWLQRQRERRGGLLSEHARTNSGGVESFSAPITPATTEAAGSAEMSSADTPPMRTRMQRAHSTPQERTQGQHAPQRGLTYAGEEAVAASGFALGM